jgi:hypothetical protein
MPTFREKIAQQNLKLAKKATKAKKKTKKLKKE